jgi:soluble lytic murein transglycosylase
VHGGNLIRVLLILIFTLNVTNLWALNLDDAESISNNTLDKYIKHNRFNISKSEDRIAKNLSVIFDISEKGYTSKKLTRQVLADVKKSRAFYIYIDWLNNLINIEQSKDVSSLRKRCSILLEKSSKNPIKDILYDNASNLCLKKYLRLLGKINSKSIKHFKEFKFVHENVEEFLNDENNKSFKYFLSQLKRDSYSHKEYSKVLTQYYIRKNISPEKDLVQYIHITPDFTRFIQMRGVEDYSTNYLFHEELEKLIKKAFVAAEEKKKKAEVLDLTKKALNYYNLSQQYLPKLKSKKHILSLGKSLLRRNYYKASSKVYESLLKNFPKEEDLLHEKMWVYLTQEEYSQAYSKVVRQYGLDKNYEKLEDPRLLFWTALTMKENYKSKYKNIFETLIKKSPLSYYSIISSKILADNEKSPSNRIYFKHAFDKEIAIKKLPSIDKYTIRSLKRLKIWSERNFTPFINLELENLKNIHSKEVARLNKDYGQKKAETALTLLAIRILNQTDNHLASFRAMYKGINNRVLTLDRTLLENLFPKTYLASLNHYNRSFDPIVALSLIRQESGFNAKARSHAGARGLMQLMPATARRYRKVNASKLYHPQINLNIGTRYLDMLYKKYDQNLVYTLSAYNAGETRVKRWRKRYLTNDSILHNIENIPFLETRKYVKLIFRNIFFYKMLDEDLKKIDTNKTNHIFDIYLGFNSLDN